MKKTLNSRMEEAGIRELMPEFDKDAMWHQISSRMPQKKRITPWPRLAAACILLVTGGISVWLLVSDNIDSSLSGRVATKQDNWRTGVLPEWPKERKNIIHTSEKDKVIVTTGDKRQQSTNERNKYIASLQRSGEFVCNSTPCPLEICITQIMKCADGTASAITSCSTVDPDQARQMRFNNNGGSDCSVTIDEIRIKRVNTGETIVLTGDSEPSTARELFDCLTGNADCNLLAGVFNNNCDNEHGPLELKIEKEGGSLILE